MGGEMEAHGGSRAARELLAAAAEGRALMLLEDASHRADVVFARVNPGRWTKDGAQKPPVYVILIDFADFQHVIGDEAARAAFNEGWAVLHEIAHVVHDSADAEEGANEPGACETLINRMRRECGLAERAEYFFDLFPGQERTAFTTRLVRLAFDLQTPQLKKKRYWLMWDANLVGGIEASKQIAAR